ncbi:hypothetical protein FG93_03019 [Bosea sp. LC85]|nr:hypothetical protein FG93_03019 [Bosea sp. LC85]
MGREQFDDIASDAKGAARKIAKRALVLQGDEIGDELALLDALAELDGEGHRRIGLDRADAVDAGDAGDDDDVVALQQRTRGRVAHAVDLLVDRGFLLDKRVRARDVGLRLVVIVIGYEVLDRIVWEEALELAVELRRECLVRGKDQGRTLRLLDHLCHREGLAGAGDAEQDLVALLPCDAVDEIGDRGRLVTCGLEIRLHAEGDATLGLVRSGRAMRRPGLAGIDEGAAGLEQVLQRMRGDGSRGLALGLAEGGSRVVLLRLLLQLGITGARLAIAGLRLVAEAGGAARDRPAAVDRGIEQIGEIALERLQLRLGGLGVRRARGRGLFCRLRLGGRVGAFRHGGNMGRNRSRREG